METKICFKCGKELTIDNFYKHPKMPDGFLGKCKDCTKDDVHKNYLKHVISEDVDYIEKERARGREKYHRLYANKTRVTPVRLDGVDSNFYKRQSINLKKKFNITKDQEIHHWNYNFLEDVFVLNKRLHKRLHKTMVYDVNSKCYIRDGILLDSKLAHLNAIYDEAKKYPDTLNTEIMVIGIN